MKYTTTTTRNDIEYSITDIVSPIRYRIDELEEKGDTVQRKTKHRRIVIKL